MVIVLPFAPLWDSTRLDLQSAGDKGVRAIYGVWGDSVIGDKYGGGTRNRRRGPAPLADRGVATGEAGTDVGLSLAVSPCSNEALEALDGIEEGEDNGRPNDHRVVTGSGPSEPPKAGLRALRNSV